MQVTVNFSSVFATIKDEKVLKEVANSISEQLKSAYGKRAQELAKSVKPKSTVTVSMETKTTEKKAAKAKSAPKKTEKAESKSAPKAEKKTTEKTEKKAESKKTEKEPQIALTNTKELKKLGLKFLPYSEKCVLLAGNTKPIAKELGKLKKSGVFGNGHLKAIEGFEGGFGWLVNKENKEYKKVCKSLHLKAI